MTKTTNTTATTNTTTMMERYSFIASINKMTKKDLVIFCKQNNFKGYSKLDKKDLIAFIVKATKPQEEPQEEPQVETPKQEEPQVEEPQVTNHESRKSQKLFDLNKNNHVNVYIPTCIQGMNDDGVFVSSLELKEDTFKIYKNVKSEQGFNFVEKLQGELLCNLATRTQSDLEKLNTLIEKSDLGEPTKKQALQLEKLTSVLNLISKTKQRYGMTNFCSNEKSFEYLCANIRLGYDITIPVNSLKNAFMAVSELLDTTLEKFLCGESVKITTEQQEIITGLKTVIKKTLEPYCKESELCNEFKLKISNKDVIRFYKMTFGGYDKGGKCVNPVKSNTQAILGRELPKYLVNKIAGEKTTTTK